MRRGKMKTAGRRRIWIDRCMNDDDRSTMLLKLRLTVVHNLGPYSCIIMKPKRVRMRGDHASEKKEGERYFSHRILHTSITRHDFYTNVTSSIPLFHRQSFSSFQTAAASFHKVFPQFKWKKVQFKPLIHPAIGSIWNTFISTHIHNNFFHVMP